MNTLQPDEYPDIHEPLWMIDEREPERWSINQRPKYKKRFPSDVYETEEDSFEDYEDDYGGDAD